MSDSEVQHYIAGVVPLREMTPEEAGTVFQSHGAVEYVWDSDCTRATFRNGLVLKVMCVNGVLTDACSITTATFVYLLSSLDTALGFITRNGQGLDVFSIQEHPNVCPF